MANNNIAAFLSSMVAQNPRAQPLTNDPNNLTKNLMADRELGQRDTQLAQSLQEALMQNSLGKAQLGESARQANAIAGLNSEKLFQADQAQKYDMRDRDTKTLMPLLEELRLAKMAGDSPPALAKVQDLQFVLKHRYPGIAFMFTPGAPAAGGGRPSATAASAPLAMKAPPMRPRADPDGIEKALFGGASRGNPVDPAVAAVVSRKAPR